MIQNKKMVFDANRLDDIRKDIACQLLADTSKYIVTASKRILAISWLAYCNQACQKYQKWKLR